MGEAAGGEGEGARDDLVDLPLRWALSAGTEPNDLTPSCFMGGSGAGEEEMGAETSSMEPKVTADAGGRMRRGRGRKGGTCLV